MFYNTVVSVLELCDSCDARTSSGSEIINVEMVRILTTADINYWIACWNLLNRCFQIKGAESRGKDTSSLEVPCNGEKSERQAEFQCTFGT